MKKKNIVEPRFEQETLKQRDLYPKNYPTMIKSNCKIGFFVEKYLNNLSYLFKVCGTSEAINSKPSSQIKWPNLLISSLSQNHKY